MGLFRIIKESSVYTIALLLPPMVSIFTLPIFTRFLSPEEYAIITLVLTFSAIAGIAISLQLQAAMLRFTTGFIARNEIENAKRYFSSILFFLLAAVLLGFFVFELLGPGLISLLFSNEKLQYAPYFRLGIIDLSITAVYGVFQGLLRARRQAGLFLSASILYLGATVGSKLVLVAMLHQGVFGMLIGTIIGDAVLVVYMIILQHAWIVRSFDRGYIRQAIIYSLPLIPHAAATFIFTLSNRIILEHYVALAVVGVFGIASSIALVPILLVDSFGIAYGPHFIHGAELDRQRLCDETKYIIGIWWVGVVAMMMGAYLFSEEAIKLLVAPAYYSAAMLVPILSLAAVGRGLYVFAGSPLFLDKTKLVPLVTVGAGIASLGLNFLLIPRFGVLGAAWATVAAHGVTFGISHYLSSRRVFSLQFPWKRMSLIVGWAVVVLIITFMGFGYLHGVLGIIRDGIAVVVFIVIGLYIQDRMIYSKIRTVMRNPRLRFNTA